MERTYDYSDVLGMAWDWLMLEPLVKSNHTATCSLCKVSVELEVEARSRPVAWNKFDVGLKEAGWKTLWLVGGAYVCPGCIAKLKRAIVPGVGVHLVTNSMLEAKQAFPIEEFARDGEQ